MKELVLLNEGTRRKSSSKLALLAPHSKSKSKLQRHHQLWRLKLHSSRPVDHIRSSKTHEDAMPRRKRRPREVSSSPSPAERDIIALSDDDEEDQATADLTLHILAKAEKRGRERAGNGAGAEVVALESDDDERGEGDAGELGGAAPSGRLESDEGEQTPLWPCDAAGVEDEVEPVVTVKARKKKKKREKEKERKERKEKQKKKASESVVNMEDAKAEPDKAAEVKLPDAEESLAMRKLLRGPRYFDPPEEQGETCYSCGQQGHRAAECTEQPRQKPCFVCGNFGHDGYDCPEKTECFECGKSGHVARNCPSKQYQPYQPRRDTGLCLLCGRLGHDASACSGEYDSDDFNQVHCYVCKQIGHLCCIEVVDASPTPLSCYQCGDLGHTGLACSRQTGDRGDNSSCYRCGQEGHFARECQRTNRDYNIKQRRHSWPAPWSADNGRFGDQEPSFTPACQIRPVLFKKRLEQAQSSSAKKKKNHEGKKRVDEGKKRKNGESRRGSKRKRMEADSVKYPLDNKKNLVSG